GNRRPGELSRFERAGGERSGLRASRRIDADGRVAIGCCASASGIIHGLSVAWPADGRTFSSDTCPADPCLSIPCVGRRAPGWLPGGVDSHLAGAADYYTSCTHCTRRVGPVRPGVGYGSNAIRGGSAFPAIRDAHLSALVESRTPEFDTQNFAI